MNYLIAEKKRDTTQQRVKIYEWMCNNNNNEKKSFLSSGFLVGLTIAHLLFIVIVAAIIFGVSVTSFLVINIYLCAYLWASK